MPNNVSIGPTTLAGWGTAGLALIGAIVTYLTGDHTARSVTAVEVAGLGFASFAITQAFRYLQAKKILPEGTALPSTAEEEGNPPPPRVTEVPAIPPSVATR
jgi:hypothetical protein